MVMGFADNIINTAMSSGVGLVSSLFFIWVVIWMMMSVERVFNNVWKVHKSRNLFKRLSFYLLVLIIAPLVLMLFFAGSLTCSFSLPSPPSACSLGAAFARGRSEQSDKERLRVRGSSSPLF